MSISPLIRPTVPVVLLGLGTIAHGNSLFFTDVERADVGRVEIRIDNPATPADIGGDDFTLEFWMRSAAGNSSGAVSCNASGYNWIEGNIVFDRDRLPDSGTRDFGLSIAGGRIAFGVETSGSYTICSDSNVLDGEWRHIAVQRRRNDGRLSLYVDGVLEQQADGPDGDVSYPNGTGNEDEPLLVIGREKYDLGPPGFRGWIDEVRLSNALRYTSNFSVATQPFAPDANTVALYHFDEGIGNTIVDAMGNASPGVRRAGGSPDAGPLWSTDTPFGTPSAGTLRLERSAYSADEQNTTVTVTVLRTGGSAGAASINYAVSGGTATAGADFDATSGSVTWTSGEQGGKSFTISIRADSDPEPDETVNITLSNPNGASLGTPNAAALTITDNDSTGGTPPPTNPPPTNPPPTNPPPTNPPPSDPPSSGGGGGGGVFDPLMWCALLLLFIGSARRRKRQFL